MKDNKELSRIEFDKQAAKFDTDRAGIYSMCRTDYPYIQRVLERLKWDSLLDVGCGTGNVLELLREEYPSAKLTGLDLSEKMLEVAKKKQIKSVEFVNGDSENMPFENDSFDVIICMQSFHHYPDPDKFFGEAHRVLKNGGVLIILDMTGPRPIRAFYNCFLLKLANKGDVHVYSKREMYGLYKNSGFRPMRWEKGAMFRFIASGKKEIY